MGWIRRSAVCTWITARESEVVTNIPQGVPVDAPVVAAPAELGASLAEDSRLDNCPAFRYFVLGDLEK